MAGDTENVWKDLDLRIDPESFFHVISDFFNEKKAKSTNILNPKSPFR